LLGLFLIFVDANYVVKGSRRIGLKFTIPLCYELAKNMDIKGIFFRTTFDADLAPVEAFGFRGRVEAPCPGREDSTVSTASFITPKSSSSKAQAIA
jgi:hypothetical protein